jgi:hypothetical protein
MVAKNALKSCLRVPAAEDTPFAVRMQCVSASQIFRGNVAKLDLLKVRVHVRNLAYARLNLS